MQEKITIVVPVYNCEKYIDKCINSILNQTYKNIEILIINDGSKDRTSEICHKYEVNKNLKVYDKKNAGVSSARNYGIKKSTGDYVMFVDSDDYIHEKHCELLYNDIKKYNADISVNSITLSNFELNSDFPKIISKNEALYKLLFDMDFFGYPVNKLYKSSILKKMKENFFDENLFWGEDLLFNINYILKCKKIVQNKFKTYFYYQHDMSRTNKKELDDKSMTLLDSCKKVIKIYSDYSYENKDFAWLFYFYNINILKDKKCSKYQKKILNFEEQKAYSIILESSVISKKEKIKVLLLKKCKILYNIVNNLWIKMKGIIK